MFYLEYECECCGFEFLSVESKNTKFEAQIKCPQCGGKNEVYVSIGLVELPPKED